MIAGFDVLPSASSSTIAASSIHGTGAQNFSSAMRNGCSADIGHCVWGRTSQAAGALRRPSSRVGSVICNRCRFGGLKPYIGLLCSCDRVRYQRLPQFPPQLLCHPPPPRTSLMTSNSNNAPMVALMIAKIMPEPRWRPS